MGITISFAISIENEFSIIFTLHIQSHRRVNPQSLLSNLILSNFVSLLSYGGQRNISVLLIYTKRPKVFELPKLQYIQQNLARAMDDIQRRNFCVCLNQNSRLK